MRVVGFPIVAAHGSWWLWNYNPANSINILPGDPIAQGSLESIRNGHELRLWFSRTTRKGILRTLSHK